ncbi:unnamed protein product [Adineta ricciae]|uniref:Ankyrin repeat domain-containing protein n=1 Tax=Adineta ricciae TaxID=249248 RepID=A0A815TUN3_ADIRI|nr:unnamed protein product [Adineta ricciae]CAF1511629.1 unnamed protein product [Adineta ricciae]
MADAGRPKQGTGQASEFYMACREGDLYKVNRYLKSMTVREINHVEESNNSTALHAAAYFGHGDVVKRLLEVGANVHTRNGYGNTAEQEAKTAEITEIFKRAKH